MTYDEAYRAGYQAGTLSMPEIVRCKDCKNSGLDSSGINGYWCSAHTEWHNGNWFCADGKMKSAE